MQRTYNSLLLNYSAISRKTYASPAFSSVSASFVTEVSAVSFPEDLLLGKVSLAAVDIPVLCAFITVRTRAMLRLTVFISPSSFLRVPLAALERNFDNSDLRSFNLFVRSDLESLDSSLVSRRFIINL